MTVRIHNCIAWQNCERRNFPSSFSLSLPPTSFFILAASILLCHPLYAGAHLRSLLSVFQIIVEFHQPINVAHPRGGLRENASFRESRAIFSFHSLHSSQAAAILEAEYSLRSSFFSLFFRIVWFFLLIFNSLGFWKVVCWPRWWKFQQGAGRWKFRWGAIEVDGNDTDKGSIRPPSRVKGRSVIMYTSQTSG